MKDTLKFLFFNLFIAFTVYLLLFMLSGRTLISWLVIVAAIAFAVWFRRNVFSPWWILWLKMKLFSILPGGNRGGSEE